jgi:hypothetical protein
MKPDGWFAADVAFPAAVSANTNLVGGIRCRHDTWKMLFVDGVAVYSQPGVCRHARDVLDDHYAWQVWTL